MTEIAALVLVALAGVLGFRFWKASAELASRAKAPSRFATVAAGLGLVVLAFEWTRAPEPNTTVSGWPFPVLGMYEMPNGTADLYHLSVMDSFAAATVANTALGLAAAFLLGWLFVHRTVQVRANSPLQADDRR